MRMDSDTNETGSESLPGSTFLSRAFFNFMSPVVRMAQDQRERLLEDEVPPHTMNLDTKVLLDFFDNEWQKQRTKHQPSIIAALVAGRWTLLLLTGGGYVVAQAISLAGPQLLKRIIQGLSCRQQRNDDLNSTLNGCEGGELRLYLCVPNSFS
jgi:hypothetical protein